MQRTIQDNYDGIKRQVKKIVFDEIKRIAADPLLKHLLKRR
jgi:hypothetical protein